MLPLTVTNPLLHERPARDREDGCLSSSAFLASSTSPNLNQLVLRGGTILGLRDSSCFSKDGWTGPLLPLIEPGTEEGEVAGGPPSTALLATDLSSRTHSGQLSSTAFHSPAVGEKETSQTFDGGDT